MNASHFINVRIIFYTPPAPFAAGSIAGSKDILYISSENVIPASAAAAVGLLTLNIVSMYSATMYSDFGLFSQYFTYM